MANTPTIRVERSERITVPKSRASYPHLFKPTAFQGEGEPKYSVSFLVPKSEAEFIARLRAAQDAAVKALYGAKKPGNFETWGITDGDDGEDEAATGCWIVKASNKQKPRVVDSTGQDILDELDVYGGCYARASIVAKAYGSSNKGGVTLELLVFQKVADGPAFGGAAKAMSAAVEELGAYEEF